MGVLVGVAEFVRQNVDLALDKNRTKLALV